MDLYSELKRNKQQFENNEISKEVYNKRQMSILNKWSGELKNHSSLIPFNAIVVNKSKEIDLYGILHLTPSANEADIKSKYKELALKYHPDKNGSAKIEEVKNEVYLLLPHTHILTQCHKYSGSTFQKHIRPFQIRTVAHFTITSEQLATVGLETIYYIPGNFSLLSTHPICVNIALMDKASFNCYVGGEFWKPYIGNLEIGSWLFSSLDSKLGYVMSAKQKERRHNTRVFSIVRYLQDKLSQFPKHDDESFKQSLRQEAQRLLAEPNGKELLSLLGDIYVSEAAAHRGESLEEGNILNAISSFISYFWFFGGLIYRSRFKEINQEEIQNIVWKLSLSEISSIAHETCEKVLKEFEYNEEKLNHPANSLFFLGQIWKEISEQLEIKP